MTPPGATHNFELYDDVLPVLEELPRGGLRLGLISNTGRDLRGFVAHHGLDVDAGIGSGAHGKSKPHPAIFRAVLERLEVEPADAAMVGDSIDDDIEGARALGMPAFLLDREGTQPELRAADREARVSSRRCSGYELWLLGPLEERLDDVDRRREDDRRRWRAADLEQRLQVAQLQRHRVLLDHDRGVLQPLGGLELAIGIDHFGTPFAFRLGLAGHRALHALAGSSTSFTSTSVTLMPHGSVCSSMMVCKIVC